jgi:menaquinol-cytochrome c reductase iron-sulfur subunit
MPGSTRRTFYAAAIYGIWGVITAALGLPALIYLLVPPRMRRQGEWVEAGDIGQLPTGMPVELAYRRMRVDGWKVVSEKDTTWVVKTADNQVTAYGPQCTHLGCPYHWDEGKNEFVCPCHNSVFTITGQVVSGPAPRPLDRYETRLQGSKLLLGRLQSPEKGA